MNEHQKTEKNCFLMDNRFHFDPVSMKLSDGCNHQSVYMSHKEGRLLHMVLLGYSRKHDLMEGLWGQRNIIVSDSSYYKVIHLLRKKLLSVGLPKETLRTQSGIGLVCILPVQPADNDSTTFTACHEINDNQQHNNNISNNTSNNISQTLFNARRSPEALQRFNENQLTCSDADIVSSDVLSANKHFANKHFANKHFANKHYEYGINVGLLIIFTNIVFLISFFCKN